MVPAPAPTPLIIPITDVLTRLDLARLFPTAQPLEVELGSGDGSFLAQYAALHPERNFLGVERLLGRLRKLERKGQRAGLRNLRCLRIEASYFLEHLVPKHSATAIHLYFPDPWPKRKHRPRRLVNENFPALARQALAPGGVLFLRTDDADYFAQMERVLGAAADFATVETPAELAGVQTDFERTFQRQGIAARRAAFRANP